MDDSTLSRSKITFTGSSQSLSTAQSTSNSSFLSGEYENTTAEYAADSLLASLMTTDEESGPKVTKAMINSKQLKHDLQLANIELSQKNLMIDSMKSEYLSKIDDLEEKLADSLYQKQLLIAQFKNQIRNSTDEIKNENQQLKREIKLLQKQQHEINKDNKKLMERAIDSKDVLINLELNEEEYLFIKGKSVEDQTLREFIAIKFYESLKPLKIQCEALQNRIELYAIGLSDKEEEVSKVFKELDEERQARTEMDVRCQKLQVHVEDLRYQLKQRDYKNENFDSLRLEKDKLERDLLEFKKKFTLKSTELEAKSSESEQVRSEFNDLRQSVSLLKQDKEYLSKQLMDLKPRHDVLEQKLAETLKSLEDLRQSREELYEKYIHSRDHYKSEYESRLRQEVDDLSRKTSLEIEKIKMNSQEIFERENRVLRESKADALAEKQRFEVIAKEAEEKYKELMAEFKSLQVSSDSKVSEGFNELRLKSYELERLQLVHEETARNLSSANHENEKLRKQKEAVDKEYNNLQLTAGRKISEFESKCTELSKKLSIYEKMEDELDDVIMQAAEVPDGQEAERVLFSYGYGANILSTAKRRMQQSVHLAKRVLQLERANSSLRHEIENETKKREQISHELSRTTVLLSEAKQPYNCLIDSIKIRDDDNKQMKGTIDTLNDDIRRLRIENSTLKKTNDQMTLDLERLLNQREEMNLLKQALIGIQCSESERGKQYSKPVTKRKTVLLEKPHEEDAAVPTPRPANLARETPSWYNRLKALNGKEASIR
ncbi:progesterone-induced-blocking factor 1-like [Rhopilema esculentum]|uniref:progesterone-induced-blocking factor 1-like n=1 Tax=Rhopilema esculentum TaxID=499914 RepID=UPI0031DBB400